MTAIPLALPDIHLFEPSGYGGVFQHTCQLGEGLHRHGRRVVLHTGHEHEQVRLDGVELCPCSWWPHGRLENRVRAGARQAIIARRLVQQTLPHLVRSVPAGAILHLQGIAAAGGLNLLTLRLARRVGHRVVYSPHDTFSRRGWVDGMLLRAAYRAPHAIIVYSHADEERLRGQPRPLYRSPLIQLVPRPSEADRLNWRREWRADEAERIVLFAGFIRPEKRLDLLIESARRWPKARRLAVVGPDRGGWARCDDLAHTYNLDIAARLQFVELEEFTAAIAAADLVVVPSEQASQSGVLAVARQLGTPTVAADVGGMAELATRTFLSGDPDDLSRAIQAALSNGSQPDCGSVERLAQDDEAVLIHLRAYEGQT
jgi:glycosyltransferase involved in cell wall biosynthesis